MNLEKQLLQRLAVFNPSHLEVVNESAGHGGYFPGKESHFKVVMVSEDFQGATRRTTSSKNLCCCR